MKLCTTMMFDGDAARLASKVRDLEAAGVDMVLIPEIYGFDQVSVLGFVAASTQRIGLMTGIVNVYSRSPALIAQTAATTSADHSFPMYCPRPHQALTERNTSSSSPATPAPTNRPMPLPAREPD